MEHQIRYVLLLAIGFGPLASAQTDSSGTAFAMTRATVEFLATDAKTYGYNKTPCQPCDTYDDLKRFIVANKLTNADRVVDDARQTAAQSSPDELGTYLLKRVTEGADHAHRTRLASFPTYQRALDAAIGGLSTTDEASVAAQPTVPADASDGESVVVDTFTTTTQMTPDSTELSDDDITSSQPSPTAQSSMSWLPLALSLLSLAGVVVLFFRRSQGQSGPAAGADKSIIDEMSRRITKLEDANTNLVNQVAFLEKAVRNPSGNVTTGQSQTRPAQPAPRPVPAPPPTASPAQPSTPQFVAPPVASVPAATPPASANTPRQPQPTAPTLFYGRTADLGDGFSVGGLSTKPDRDTVFEILRIDAGRAQFQVSDNPDLQRLALSDPYSYLNDTCIYATQPRPGSHIRTERPGTLSLQGEKWVITEKAQVSFTG